MLGGGRGWKGEGKKGEGCGWDLRRRERISARRGDRLGFRGIRR